MTMEFIRKFIAQSNQFLSILTPKLLKTAKKYNIKLTFFILGQSLSKFLDLNKTKPNPVYKENRAILRQMVADGHAVGSHTFDHTNLSKLGTYDLQKQMNITSSLIKRTVGIDVSLMRAPEGLVFFIDISFFRALSMENIDDLHSLGYKIIHWNTDTKDYEKKKSKQLDKFFQKKISPASKSRKGLIILQHDIFSNTVKSQHKIIPALLEKGYTLVDMYTCLGLKAA